MKGSQPVANWPQRRFRFHRWRSLLYCIHHELADSRPFSTRWTHLARLRDDLLSILSNQTKELELLDEVDSLPSFKKRNCVWNDIK